MSTTSISGYGNRPNASPSAPRECLASPIAVMAVRVEAMLGTYDTTTRVSPAWLTRCLSGPAAHSKSRTSLATYVAPWCPSEEVPLNVAIPVVATFTFAGIHMDTW